MRISWILRLIITIYSFLGCLRILWVLMFMNRCLMNCWWLWIVFRFIIWNFFWISWLRINWVFNNNNCWSWLRLRILWVLRLMCRWLLWVLWLMCRWLLWVIFRFIIWYFCWISWLWRMNSWRFMCNWCIAIFWIN